MDDDFFKVVVVLIPALLANTKPSKLLKERDRFKRS
jgi:hypothetical protein